MFRTMLCSLVMLSFVVGCNHVTDKNAKEATITKVDPKTGNVIVKMQSDGKETEKTFKLAENIEYMDGKGNVASADIFTSGDLVLIVEADGKVTKMTKKKDQADATTKTGSKDKTDKEAKVATETFIRTADQTDLAEMKLGKFAAENAESGIVKKFGERMVRDHSSMNKELREIAKKQGFAVTDQLDPKHQDLMEQMSKLKGVQFDMVYTKDMVEGHENALKEFESEAKKGGDAEVKAWAEKWLPTLREHLKLAQEAVKDVKGK